MRYPNVLANLLSGSINTPDTWYYIMDIHGLPSWYNLHMGTNSLKIELLSPAGSPESLIAAVASGADSVYIGLDEFNARANAVNFNKSNLSQYVEYCHIRGVRVFLALNILLYDNEIQNAYEAACFAYNTGIDAVIIQDMGLLSVLKKEFPELELHASTQTSINSREGVEYMGSHGFSRVILAREMNLASIREASSSGVQTEVFVHGARCYSYSGQCLMSSMLGGRSGNRGMCAQPCRLPYTLLDDKANILLKGHLLSLKDTLYIDSLSALKDAGVSALKIEGRMKNPEYVAAVTGIYRKYLDMDDEYHVLQEDFNELLKAFNREGFSKGALSKFPGKNEFAIETPGNSGFAVGKVLRGTAGGSLVEFTADVQGSDGLKLNNSGSFAGKFIKAGASAVIRLEGRPGDIIYRTKDTQFLKRYSTKRVLEDAPSIPIHAAAAFKTGRQPELTLIDSDGNTAHVILGAAVQKAVSSGTPCSRIRSQLLKTGGTPYEITHLDFECSEGIYIKISDVNDLRRSAVNRLTELREHSPVNISPKILEPVIPASDNTLQGKTSICFYHYPENIDLSVLEADRIYVEPSAFDGDLACLYDDCRENDIDFFIHIPYSCQTIPDVECDGYLIENYGMLSRLTHPKTVLGTGFNVTNSYALSHHKDFGSVTLSYELDYEHISLIKNSENTPLEMVVYGKAQVMESPYCPAKDICSGDLCIRKNLHLIDRKNEEWDTIFNPSEHSIRIFNPHKIMIIDSIGKLREAGISWFRLNIFDETANEVYALASSIRTGQIPSLDPGYKFTHGHFR